MRNQIFAIAVFVFGNALFVSSSFADSLKDQITDVNQALFFLANHDTDQRKQLLFALGNKKDSVQHYTFEEIIDPNSSNQNYLLYGAYEANGFVVPYRGNLTDEEIINLAHTQSDAPLVGVKYSSDILFSTGHSTYKPELYRVPKASQ